MCYVLASEKNIRTIYQFAVFVHNKSITSNEKEK